MEIKCPCCSYTFDVAMYPKKYEVIRLYCPNCEEKLQIITEFDISLVSQDLSDYIDSVEFS